MIYEACFRAKKNFVISPWYYYTNKKDAIHEIREMAEINRSDCGDCNWCVYVFDTQKRVAAGGMTKDGKRYRLQ